MDKSVDFHIPDCDEFRKGYQAFNANATRGHCYFNAMSHISKNWGKPRAMADGVGILISCWNRFYANFDYDKLAKCIDANLTTLNDFKARNINSLSNGDADRIRSLFDQFLDALARERDNKQSAVSVAKAFGVLAPDFLPMMDSTIAGVYGCLYIIGSKGYSPDYRYVEFCKKMKLLAERVKDCVPDPDDRSLLKRIDEYNMWKYTMHRIC